MHERKKFCGWLVGIRNKYDAFDGDFIQRHAKAAALYHDIHVLFVKQFSEQKSVAESVKKNGGLTEQLVYLPKENKLIGKIYNYRNWIKVYKEKAGFIINRFKPQIIHVHVPWRVGLIALWARKRFDIPYIVTEHWGIYNNVVDDNIHRRPFYVRWLLKTIYQDSNAFVSVSQFLGEAVNQSLAKMSFTVIPNVVDTALFHPAERKHERFTLLHVSNMVPLKNVEGILRAFKIFLEQADANAQLVMVGNKNDEYVLLAQKLGLSNAVFSKGEIGYPNVAKEMQGSHVFVLNSNMENSPCVIGEALCCGLPVIATRVGGIPELVNEKAGILIPLQDVTALAQAMMKMLRDYAKYDAADIAAAAKEKFSSQVIGAAFSGLYNNFVKASAQNKRSLPD